jgi:integrase
LVMPLKNGPNGLPKGSGLYWVRDTIYAAIYVGGEKHVLCTKTDNVKEAIRLRNEKRADLELNHVEMVKRGVRIKDLFDDFLGHRKRKEQGRGEYMADKHGTPSYKAASPIKLHLVPAFGNLKPDKLTTELLLKYRDDRIAAKASVVTVNNELGCLRSALNLGTKTTPRKVNPLKIPSFDDVIDTKAEKQKARTGTISPEQYTRVMEVAPYDFIKPIFATVCETGIRSKEMKFIRPEQVNFTQHQIELRAGETKNGRERIVAISDKLEELLKAWKLKTESEYPNAAWFFHKNGKKLKTYHHQWNRTLRLAGLRVKLEDGKWKNLVMFHDTRRTSVTLMDAAKISQADRMKNSGHTHEDMDSKYAQNTQLAKERVRQALNDYNAGSTLTTPVAVPVLPVVSVSDWKADLRELKAAFEEGLLPQDLYNAEVAKVMVNR